MQLVRKIRNRIERITGHTMYRVGSDAEDTESWRDQQHVKCPRCGKIYTEREYERLPRVPVDPRNPNAGTTAVCPRCGARFMLDRMTLKDNVMLGNCIKATVSTVDLVLEHDWNGEPGYYYETAIFFDNTCPNKDINYPFDIIIARYKTKEEAIRGHKTIVENLRKGKGYRFIHIPKLVIKPEELIKK